MGRKRAREEGKGGTDWPPVPPSPLPPLSLSTSANNKTWKEYLMAEGLVSEEMLVVRDIRPFQPKASRARKYMNNLSENLSNLKGYILKVFDLQASPPPHPSLRCGSEPTHARPFGNLEWRQKSHQVLTSLFSYHEATYNQGCVQGYQFQPL